MKNKLIQFSVILLLFFTAQVYANPINKINFIGLNNTSESTLLKSLSFKVGQNFSPDASDEIIEELFKTGFFSDIKIIKNEKTLDITLIENPYIRYIDVNLNSGSGLFAWLTGEKLFLTSEVVNEHLESSNLSAGNIYTKRKLDDFVSLLQSKYEESGYYAVKISQDIKLDNQNRIEIELSIAQGARATIESFSISGYDRFSEKELLKLFKIGEADMVLVNYFTNKDDYNDSELRNGINLMTNTYFDSGYLDFKIVDVTSNLDDKKEKLSINIEISEGIQYKLGKVSFEGELANIP